MGKKPTTVAILVVVVAFTLRGRRSYSIRKGAPVTVALQVASVTQLATVPMVADPVYGLASMDSGEAGLQDVYLIITSRRDCFVYVPRFPIKRFRLCNPSSSFSTSQQESLNAVP